MGISYHDLISFWEESIKHKMTDHNQFNEKSTVGVKWGIFVRLIYHKDWSNL